MNEAVKAADIIKPQTEWQWVILAFLLFGALIFFIWIKWGRDKTIQKAIDDKFNEITYTKRESVRGDYTTDKQRTDIFKVEQVRGLAAVNAKLEGVERHYERNFDKIDKTIEGLKDCVSRLQLETELMKNAINMIKDALEASE